ncbi:MAG: type II toxin-antitoxin system HicA family toxin [Pirellulales bacterium]
MGKVRLKLRDLTRILQSYGVSFTKKRGKGDHILFWKQFTDGRFSYPIPDKPDVLPCYVKGARKKFRLLPSDGVTDEEFLKR